MRCFAFRWSLAVAVLAAATVASADDEIRLSGCLVRGQDGKGYLMTNVPGEAAWQRPGDAIVIPGPVGTSGTVTSILYWLEKKNGLDDHVGHFIEIEGKLQGDLQDGEIKVTPKGEWTEVEVEAGGKSLKAQVPRSVLIIPDKSEREPDKGERKLDKGERTRDVLVRRVEPQRVRMLGAVCGR